MSQTTTSAGIEQNRLLGDVYRSVLKLHTSLEPDRKWMTTPFFVGEKVVATNGTSLIAVPKFTDEFEDLSEKTKTVYPVITNRETHIPLSELKDAITKVPLIDCFDETQTKCGACYGEGEVEFEFDYKLKSYSIEHECPVCEGQGITYRISDTPNGKKEIDYSKFIRIGECFFQIKRVEELIQTAELLNLNEVVLVKQTGVNQSNLFQLDTVELLLMPCMMPNQEDVCANIA